MPSVKLSSEARTQARGWFNPTLFKKNVTRFWPIWGIYTAMLFFLLPMELISYGAVTRRSEAAVAGRYVISILGGTLRVGVALAVVFGLLTAMALFSYLMNHRSCQLLHGLPIRREGLFITNWLSGLWFFAVPNAVIALLSGLIGMALRLPVFPDVGLWFLILTALDMFFFCFAMCCAMFTGNILALPAFYGVLNGLVIGMSFLVDLTLRQLLIGFSGAELSSTDFARWCTPVYQLEYLLSSSYTETTNLYRELSSPVGAICYCIVLGAAFTFIAGVVYRYRQLERAGDLVTVGWVRPVFQYGFGACIGLSFGWVLFQNFFEGAWSLIVLVVICAALGAFAGRMMLKKTLRVFGDGWKGVTVFAAVLLLLLGGARADLFGYQRWTPDPAKVKEVTVYNVDSAPWDDGDCRAFTLDQPEDIEAVVDFHAALVSDLDRLENDGYAYYETDETGTYDVRTSRYVRLTYTMADGTQVARRWDSVPVSTQELNVEESYTYKLQALLNRPAAVYGAYMDNLGEGEVTAVGGWLSGAAAPADAPPETNAITITVDANASEEEMLEQYWQAQEASSQRIDRDFNVTLTADEAEKLWQTVQADLAAGDLGRRYLLETEERYANCYRTDLVITLMRVWTDETGKRRTNTRDVTFCLQASGVRTLKALEELGYKDRLVPWDKDG